MNFLKNYSPWILALLWLGIRWICHTTIFLENRERGFIVGVLTNLLFIIILVFQVLWDLYKERRKGHTGYFLSDLKRVAFPSIKYVIGIGIVIFCYYHFISDELMVKRSQDLIANELATDTPEEIKQIIAGSSQLKGYNAEQIKGAMDERTELFTHPTTVSTLSFLFLAFTSLFYSLFAVFLFRNFLKLK